MDIVEIILRTDEHGEPNRLFTSPGEERGHRSALRELPVPWSVLVVIAKPHKPPSRKVTRERPTAQPAVTLSGAAARVRDKITLSAGHTSRDKTLDRVRRRFWWPRMDLDVAEWVKTCVTCQQTQPRQGYPMGLLQPHRVPSRLWEVVSIDFVTGLPMTQWGVNAFATFTCKLSKMVHVVPMTYNGNSVEVVVRLFMDTIWRLHGAPMKIVCDRDPRFRDAMTQEFMRLMGVKAARVNLHMVQQRMIEQFDARHRLQQMKVNDQVWVDGQHLTFRGDRGLKLKLRKLRHGPLRIVECLYSDRQQELPEQDRGAPSAYRLELPVHGKVHDVFTADRLTPVQSGAKHFVGRQEEMAPPPVMVEGQREREVERIIGTRFRKLGGKAGGTVQEWLTKWKGLPHSHNQWRTREDLEGKGDLELADRRVQRTRAIIEYYAPAYFFIENPAGDALRGLHTRAVMKVMDLISALTARTDEHVPEIQDTEAN
ncbi:hypothetical protein CYMTET_42384 [Cymbomonas tetramitiformis]|uniref:Chromo domain-containing protein n=1 Tax=Cymbomonas tetramitiformis TaxID=36881 RepID=A0AAE0C493_9CHLO|nr:hypothetical protein CYMTET_42384 [Cymbomonas tetramitiformis]